MDKTPEVMIGDALHHVVKSQDNTGIGLLYVQQLKVREKACSAAGSHIAYVVKEMIVESTKEMQKEIDKLRQEIEALRNDVPLRHASATGPTVGRSSRAPIWLADSKTLVKVNPLEPPSGGIWFAANLLHALKHDDMDNNQKFFNEVQTFFK